MPAHRVQALVIRTVDVFETSRIVTLFTREFGKISALAKGGRRLKSPFQAALDLLSVCDMVIHRKSTDALDLATEAVLVERHPSLRADLSALFSGYYVAELLHDLTDVNDPHPKLFDAAKVTLRHLGDGALRSRRLLRFELACLREVGYMPQLDSCVHCGAEVPIRSERESVAFGLSTGGVLCPSCKPGQPHVATLTGRTLDALRMLASPGNDWRQDAWSVSTLASLRGTIGAVVCHRLGKKPKMLSYLKA